MDLEKFKRWHWILIGLLIGAILGSAHLFFGPGVDQAGEENFDAYQFESDVLYRPPPAKLSPWLWKAVAGGGGYLTDIVIHPPVKDSAKPNSEIVTGKVWYLKPMGPAKTLEFAPTRFLYMVPVPYVPKPNYLNNFLRAPDHYVADAKAPGGFARAKTLPAPNYKPLEPDPFDLTADAAKERKALGFKESWLKGIISTGKLPEVKARSARPAATEGTAKAKTPEERMADFRAQLVDVKAQEAAIDTRMVVAPHIKDYLDLLNKKYPDAHIKYRIAWEEKPAVTFAIWTVGTTVLVGGIWPILLSLMSGAGLGLRRSGESDDYDLSRFKGSRTKTSKSQQADLTLDDKERLKALEAELEKNLQGGLDRGAAIGGKGNTVVPTLGGAPEESKAPEAVTPKPPKAFGAGGGDFYPTEVHGKKNP